MKSVPSALQVLGVVLIVFYLVTVSLSLTVGLAMLALGIGLERN